MKQRTRAVQQTRTVPVTRDGKTHLATRTTTVHIPKPPRDWDQIVLGAVTGVCVTAGLGCIAWSTSSIGSLLATAAPRAVAYPGAGTYDLLWMTCFALEWLARHDPRKAVAPHRAGLLALALAMTAMVAEGYRTGHLAAGIIGATISLGVKRLWTLVLSHHAHRLDSDTQQWVDLERAEIGGELALAAVRRGLARSRSHLAAYAAAYAPAAPSGQHPDTPDSIDPDELSAIRAALTHMPDASAEDLVEQLARIGIDTTADTVRTVSGQHTDSQDSSSGKVLALAPHDPADTITDTVRTAVRTVGRDLDAVLAAVRRVHGPDVKRETVRRILSDRVTA